MNSRINSIFMSVLFMCVSSQNTVLKVFETERNMFYRHKNAKMYNTGAIIRAFTFAEIPFILMTSTAFTLIFYFFLGYVLIASVFFPSIFRLL
jgi:ABC-type multidrug transport system permease subunit